MLKRVALFLAANIAILFIITLILSIFNIQPYLTAQGINYGALMAFALVVGFTGSFFSLFLSKFMAKMAYGIQLIDKPNSPLESNLVEMIHGLARKLNLGIPEIGIYNSPAPNAFATGWSRQHALVAVSTGLLQTMNMEEIEGVLGHEMSHIANGDMITMCLLQGVLNTFVIFFARIAAFFVANLLRGNNERSDTGGFVYYGTALLFQIVFGILASLIVMAFSRHREFRADAGSARLVGKEKMIAALQRLQRAESIPEDHRAPSMATLQISSHDGLFALFASHPPLQKRIDALLRKS